MMPEAFIQKCKAVLVLASILYLGVEVVFNMSLLEAISRIDLNHDTFYGVEQFGRRASSTGFSLAVIGLFLSTGFAIEGKFKWGVFLVVSLICALPFVVTPYFQETLLYVIVGVLVTAFGSRINKARYNIRAGISVVGLVVMTWSAFYYGKIALTDHYLVDTSTGAERLAARYVSLLRRSLVTDTVQLHDVALSDFGGVDEPEAKAFLVMLGPLALNADSLLKWAEEQKNVERVVRTLASSQKVVNIPERYQEYLSRRDAFKRDVYVPYSQASKDFIERGKAMQKEAANSWVELQKSLDDEWERYRTANNDFVSAHIKIAEDGFAQRFETFLNWRQGCGDNASCQQRYDADFQKQITSIANPPPPWEHFCDKKEKNPFGLGCKTTTSGGITQFSCGFQKGDSYNCDTSANNLGQRLAYWKKDEFKNHKDNKAKVPLGLHKKEFLEHENVSLYAAKNLRKEEGLDLPQGWKITDQKEFYDAFQVATDNEAQKQWQTEMTKQFGADVPSGLSMDALTQTSAVQSKLKNELGDDYTNGFVFSWSEKEYAQRVIYPAIERQVREELRLFREDAKLFENGGRSEIDGKDIFRAAIIPPIAVALSLFFSFVSAAKVATALLTPLLIKINVIRSFGEKAFSAAVWVSSMALLCLMPFGTSNQYAESQAWKILSTEAREKAPIITTMAEYVIRTQPILAMAGYPLMAVFDPYDLKPGRMPVKALSTQNATTEARSNSYSKPESSVSSADVKFVQDQLGLVADGVDGPNTGKAVRRKQSQLGLKQTGVIDQEFMGRLRAQADGSLAKSASGTPAPSPQCTIELQAHRGGGQGPENTLQAVQTAQKNNFGTAEIDVIPLSDGRWVLHHDPVTGRVVQTGNDPRPISLMTTRDWEAAHLKSGGRPSFLIDVVVRTSIPLNMELKGGTCDQIAELVKMIASKRNDVSYSSTSIDRLECVLQVAPKVYTGYVAPLDGGSYTTAQIKAAKEKGGLLTQLANEAERHVTSTNTNKVIDQHRLTASDVRKRLGANAGYHVDSETLMRNQEFIPEIRDSGLKLVTYSLLGDRRHAQALTSLDLIPDASIIDGNPSGFCHEISNM